MVEKKIVPGDEDNDGVSGPVESDGIFMVRGLGARPISSSSNS